MRTFAAFLLLLIGGAAAAGIAGSGSASEMGAARATIVRRVVRQEHDGSKEIERVGTERVLIDSRGHTTSAQQKHIAATNKNDRKEDNKKDKYGSPIYKGSDGREYSPVRSKTCAQKQLFPVPDKAVCKSLAEAAGLQNTKVEEIDNSQPEGCFHVGPVVGNKLLFNTNKEGQATKATERRPIVCTATPPTTTSLLAAEKMD